MLQVTGVKRKRTAIATGLYNSFCHFFLFTQVLNIVKMARLKDKVTVTQ